MNTDLRKGLEKEFNSGTLPKKLDGFYRGSLSGVIPGTPLEFLTSYFLKMYLPWKGKYFYPITSTGNNLLPYSIELLASLLYGKETVIKKEKDGFHAFNFKTSEKKGLKNNITVLQLDYDISENPQIIREVVDELVCVGDKSYLGKAYFKKSGSVRCVAYFRLHAV